MYLAIALQCGSLIRAWKTLGEATHQRLLCTRFVGDFVRQLEHPSSLSCSWPGPQDRHINAFTNF